MYMCCTQYQIYQPTYTCVCNSERKYYTQGCYTTLYYTILYYRDESCNINYIM